MFCYQVLGYVDAVSIVGCDEEHAVFLQIVNDVDHALVIAFVCVFKCVPDWRFNTLFCSKSSLFVHVSATDQLDAKVEAEHLGGGDLISNGLGHSLEVALVTIQDDVLVSDVEQVCHLLAK